MKKTLLLLFAIMAFGLSGCDRNPLPAQAKMSDAVDVASLKGCDMAIFDEGKVTYGAAVDFGHVGYGPLCFATLDGKVQKALCYDYNGACFGWLANGKLAYFGNDGIYVVSPDGTEQKIASPHEFVTCY